MSSETQTHHWLFVAVVVYSVSLCWSCCDLVEVLHTSDSSGFDPLLSFWPLIWWNCPQKTSFPCILNIWSSEVSVGMQFESLSHTFWLFHQLMCLMCRPSNTLTLTVVLTSCCVERWHKVYCPERLFTDMLKMTNFIDLAHAHTHWSKVNWEDHNRQFHSHRPSKPSIMRLSVNQIETSVSYFC